MRNKLWPFFQSNSNLGLMPIVPNNIGEVDKIYFKTKVLTFEVLKKDLL